MPALDFLNKLKPFRRVRTQNDHPGERIVMPVSSGGYTERLPDGRSVDQAMRSRSAAGKNTRFAMPVPVPNEGGVTSAPAGREAKNTRFAVPVPTPGENGTVDFGGGSHYTPGMDGEGNSASGDATIRPHIADPSGQLRQRIMENMATKAVDHNGGWKSALKSGGYGALAGFAKAGPGGALGGFATGAIRGGMDHSLDERIGQQNDLRRDEGKLQVLDELHQGEAQRYLGDMKAREANAKTASEQARTDLYRAEAEHYLHPPEKTSKPHYFKQGGVTYESGADGMAMPVTDAKGQPLPADQRRPIFLPSLSADGVSVGANTYDPQTHTALPVLAPDGTPIVSKRVMKIDPVTGMTTAQGEAANDRKTATIDRKNARDERVRRPSSARGGGGTRTGGGSSARMDSRNYSAALGAVKSLRALQKEAEKEAAAADMPGAAKERPYHLRRHAELQSQMDAQGQAIRRNFNDLVDDDPRGYPTLLRAPSSGGGGAPQRDGGKHSKGRNYVAPRVKASALHELIQGGNDELPPPAASGGTPKRGRGKHQHYDVDLPKYGLQ